jgi:phosphoribosyl 1,2-cyclic phosphate phosphodiesterase
MKITILGCGGSGGVPLVGGENGAGDWGQCDASNPKNRRLRASIAVFIEGKTVLVDTSPDLRQQLLSNKISNIDAIVYTHAHADHCHGIDDIRSLNALANKALPAFADVETAHHLKNRFGYVFTPLVPKNGFYKPSLTIQAIHPPTPFEIEGVMIQPVWLDHGTQQVVGYCFKNAVYMTDCSDIPKDSWAFLEDKHTIIIDCLQRKSHPTHSWLDKTLGFIQRLNPKRAILTHMNTDLDYETLKNSLPPTIEPAFDGMILDVPEQGCDSSLLYQESTGSKEQRE